MVLGLALAFSHSMPLPQSHALRNLSLPLSKNSNIRGHKEGRSNLASSVQFPWLWQGGVTGCRCSNKVSDAEVLKRTHPPLWSSFRIEWILGPLCRSTIYPAGFHSLVGSLSINAPLPPSIWRTQIESEGDNEETGDQEPSRNSLARVVPFHLGGKAFHYSF